MILFLQWLTLAAVLGWLLVYWQGGAKTIADIKHSWQTGASRLDTVLLVGMTALTLVILGAAGAVCLNWLAAPQNGAITAVGAGLTGLGIAGTFYARHYLGRLWTAETTLRPEHQVIDTGPYGVVRHPIYTGATLLYLGLGLTFPVWWNGLACLLVIVSYALKAREEEKFLRQQLPGYAAYCQRVRRRLVPGVW